MTLYGAAFNRRSPLLFLLEELKMKKRRKLHPFMCFVLVIAFVWLVIEVLSQFERLPRVLGLP